MIPPDNDPLPVNTVGREIEVQWGETIKPFLGLTDDDIRYLSTPQERRAGGLSDYEPKTLADPGSSITVIVKIGDEGHSIVDFELSLQPFNPAYFDVVYSLMGDVNHNSHPPHVPFGLEWGLRASPDGGNEIINAPVLMFASPKEIPDAFREEAPDAFDTIRGISFSMKIGDRTYDWTPGRSSEDFYYSLQRLEGEDHADIPSSHMFILQPDQLHLLRDMELRSDVDIETPIYPPIQ